MATKTFTYTLIPADSSEPMQDITLPVPPTLEENIGCLTTALNAHYSRVAPIVGEAGKQAVMDSVRAQLNKNNPEAGVPDETMLGLLAGSQTVDIVQLLACTKASGFVGVNLYVDDKGQSKQSPTNERASQICAFCGIPQAVLGDAFLAKMWDDQDGFERHDLTVADVRSDAEWVQAAAAANANRSDPAAAAKMLSSTSSTGGQAPSPPLPPLKERLPAAVAAKSSGTELFKQGDVEGAAAKYAEAAEHLRGAGRSEASDAEPEQGEAAELLVTCLVNLAMCRIKQQRPTCALEACDRALAIDDNHGKAWFRRGQACVALEQYAAGQRNLHRAATLLPTSRDIREEYARCQALYAEKKASAAAQMMDLS